MEIIIWKMMPPCVIIQKCQLFGKDIKLAKWVTHVHNVRIRVGALCNYVMLNQAPTIINNSRYIILDIIMMITDIKVKTKWIFSSLRGNKFVNALPWNFQI